MIDYNEAKYINWPLAEPPVATAYDDLLKSLLIDARFDLYGNYTSVSRLYLSRIVVTKANLSFHYTVQISFGLNTNGQPAEFMFTFDSDASYKHDSMVRVDFDSDTTPYIGTLTGSFRGYVVFNRLSDLFQLVNTGSPIVVTGNTTKPIAELPGSDIALTQPTPAATRTLVLGRSFVPTVVHQVTKAKVDSLTAYTSVPLGSEDPDLYTPVGTFAGDVRLVAGLNCSLLVSKTANTLTISAQRNANRTAAEACGVWPDAVAPSDVLCDEVFYAIAGATPDDRGSVTMQVTYPLSITSNATTRTISIGLVADKTNSNIFTCS